MKIVFTLDDMWEVVVYLQDGREIDEMVKLGGDRELIEYIYDKLIERVCSEMDRRLMGGTDDDTV